jgi:hypothetical protein
MRAARKYDGLDLRQVFVNTIAQGISVPGLSAEILNAEQKLEWIRPLGFKSLADAYAAHPTLRTYLEHHPNTKGEPLSLEARPYLLDIIVDQAQDVVVQKSVQCGITEIALVWAYTEAQDGQSVLYALPGYPERNRFVADRVDKQLATSAYYRACLWDAGEALDGKASDAKGLKHFGMGVLHFVGTNTPGEFSQFPADMLVVDERDLCNPANLGLAKDRLSESEYKRTLSIGNPRKPGAYHTVGKLYEQSDGKQWRVKCGSCNKGQALDWYVHFVQQDDAGAWHLRDKRGRPVCSHCHKPFNRLGPGRWVAQRKSSISGYHISKLFTASADIHELFDTFVKSQHNETLLQIFHESELGIYYLPQASYMSLPDLVRCVGKGLNDWPRMPITVDGEEYEYPVVMGVDVGAVLHVKASYIDDDGHRVAMFIGTLAGFGDLQSLVSEMHPAVIVIDAQPEVHKVQEFAADCPSPVWPCEFGSQELTKPYDASTNQRTGQRKVRANRTAVMDASYAAIRTRQVWWPPQAQHTPDFFAQMQVPVRVLDKAAARGAGRYIWTKGEDHYRLADTYEWLAARIMDEQGVTFEWLN